MKKFIIAIITMLALAACANRTPALDASGTCHAVEFTQGDYPQVKVSPCL